MWSLSRLRSMPPLLGAALLAAAIIGAVQHWRGGRARVPVVGSGAVSALREEDAPPGFRYELDTVSGESLASALSRIDAQIATWPDVIVHGLSGRAGRPDEVLAELERRARGAENAAAGLVLVGFAEASSEGDLRALRSSFREALCAPQSKRICVEVSGSEQDLGTFRMHVARGVHEASLRQQRLRKELYR